MKKRYLITTPIYYVNDKPHIGHAYTTVAADVLTRYLRLFGNEIFFLTGTDEHGSKVAASAEEAGLTPQKFCDLNADLYKQAWSNLDIQYDYFVRTTDHRHEKAVQKFLTQLSRATFKKEKIVYAGEYKGLYCVGCEKFLTEKELENGVCPDHRTAPQQLSEKNYFFRLNAFLEKIADLIAKEKFRILPSERKAETLGLLKQKLEDFSISREKVSWGITLPFDSTQKAYVWVDALLNYITALGYEDNFAEFEKWWNKAQVIQFIGKDILKFHAIFWPAMLLALNLKTPDIIFGHGYFTVDGKKMSKTLGNVIDPSYLVEQFGTDATRYLLLTQFNFGQDGDVQEAKFTLKYNSDLANDLGNLASRIFKMIASFSQGKIPRPSKLKKADLKLKKLSLETIKSVTDKIYNLKLTSGIEEILKLTRATNKYVESQRPWDLAKKDKTRLNAVLYVSCESLRIIGQLFYPVLPQKGLEILSALQIRFPFSFEVKKNWGVLKPNTYVLKPKPLFPRLSVEKVKPEMNTGQINLDEFKKASLRTARVYEAARISGTDKLLLLKIDLGSEKKEIVAGIGDFYKPEELLNKNIIVLTNLKPATIRGVKSEGMLLVARKGEKMGLLTVDSEIESGAEIS